MIDLNDFRYFVEVVDRGGFSAAAQALERPTSTVSFRIQQLERELGLTLLARTSRSVVMTQAGEELYSHATAMLERANEAEALMRGRREEPTGTVRYTVASAVAQFSMPDMLLSFWEQYPDVRLEQHVANAQVDVIADRYDLAIRAHSKPLPDSQLVQRPLADVPWHLFASPAYLERTGRLHAPRDLEGRETLFMKRKNVDPILHLLLESDPSEGAVVPLEPLMLGECMVTLKHAAEAGKGIVALPAYACRNEIRSGTLERVLPDWLADKSTITALMPHRRGMTAATRAFIDHIAASFPRAVRLDPDA